MTRCGKGGNICELLNAEGEQGQHDRWEERTRKQNGSVHKTEPNKLLIRLRPLDSVVLIVQMPIVREVRNARISR